MKEHTPYTHSNSVLSVIERDDLTYVYTRTAFLHYASIALAMDADTDYMILVSDIADFKRVIELYGEKEAYETVKINARMLEEVLPEGSIIGRYGIDQFACLVPKQAYLAKEEEVRSFMSTIRKADDFRITVKLSVCDCRDRKLSLNLYVEHAYAALGTIKHLYGRDYAVVDEALLGRLHRQSMIEENMEEALKQEQFQVYYQPKHDVKTGKLVGAEALVRWIHPTLGFMSPGEFIPIFEQTGFITEVDAYVWEKTCQNLHRWMEMGLPVVPVSVNSSRIEFTRDNRYFERRAEMVRKWDVPAEMMHIEMTETMFGDRMDEVVSVLEKCHSYGFGIELDDFGIGYSSLHTLGDLPLDVVKLDMSFVQQLDDPKKERVTTGCVNLIKSMNLKVVAEGVETSRQEERIKELEIDMVQGYLYSRPLQIGAYEDYLRNSQVIMPEEVRARDGAKRVAAAVFAHKDNCQKLFMHLLGGVLNVWSAVYIIDVRTGRSEELCGDSYFRENVTESVMSDEIMRTYVEKSLVPEYREAYLRFFDFSTMEERFKEKTCLTFEFEDEISGRMRSTIAPSKYDINGHLTHIMLAAEHLK